MASRLTRAKNVDLYFYMTSKGFKPTRENKNNAYFLSPKRNESNPSFVLDRVKNRWTDYGDDTAYGDIIDFVEWVEGCNTKQAVDIILGDDGLTQYHKPDIHLEDIKRIEVVEEHDEITNEVLINYLEEQRHIPVDVANKYCSEVLFQFSTKMYIKYYGIGMKNDKGGWSIRGIWFKGTTKPSGISTPEFDAESLTVNLFEGMFDFLSFTMLKEPPYDTCIVLNSLVFIPMITTLLHGYDEVNLYLDNDGAANDKIDFLYSQGLRPIDRRDWYKDYNDLNDYLVAEIDI